MYDEFRAEGVSDHRENALCIVLDGNKKRRSLLGVIVKSLCRNLMCTICHEKCLLARLITLDLRSVTAFFAVAASFDRVFGDNAPVSRHDGPVGDCGEVG